jgi:hypothetical protein
VNTGDVNADGGNADNVNADGGNEGDVNTVMIACSVVRMGMLMMIFADLRGAVDAQDFADWRFFVG